MKERQKGLNLGWLSDSRNEIYGFAILWIMVYHGNYWNGFDYSFGQAWLRPLRVIFGAGNTGVEMFLLLSGISLYFSFSRNQDLLGFYKKRYLRLYPGMFLIVGGYWFYLFLQDMFTKGMTVVHAGARFFMHATQLSFWCSSDQLTWYVAAISVFYFVYPFLYHALFDDEKKTVRRLVLMLVFTAVALLAMRVSYPKMYKQVEIALTRFPAFLIGCGLGKLVYEHKKISWWWLSVPAAMLLLTALVAALDMKPWLDAHALWRYIMLFIGFSAMVFAGLLFHFVSWKPFHAFFKFFGNLSFEIYLTHIVLYHVADILLDGRVLRMREYALVILVTIPVAWIVAKAEDILLSKKSKESKKEKLPTA